MEFSAWDFDMLVFAAAVYIADSIKVALGIGNCALGSYCLVVTQVNY